MAEEVELLPGQQQPGLPPEGQSPPPEGQTAPPEGQTTSPDGKFAQEPHPLKSKKDDRPDWLPEKFFVNGEPQFENLAKSYSEAEKKLRQTREEIAAEIRDEVVDKTKRPEAPEKYALPKIEDDRIDPDALASHPTVEWFRQFAFERGMGQEDFNTAVSQYVGNLLEQIPDVNVEMKKLGDDAEARVSYVKNWVEANVPESERDLYHTMATTAEGFRKVEQIIKGKGAKPPSPGEDPAPGAKEKTHEEIKALMAKPEYFDPIRRDPALVAEVSAWFDRNASKL